MNHPSSSELPTAYSIYNLHKPAHIAQVLSVTVNVKCLAPMNSRASYFPTGILAKHKGRPDIRM